MQTQQLDGLYKEFAETVTGSSKFPRGENKIFFCFNGISYIGGTPVGIMLIDSWTNDISINKQEHIFDKGHRMSKLWTITLKLDENKWTKLLEYGNKYELTFDAILMNERDNIRDVPFRKIFKHQITLDKDHVYNVDISHEEILGQNKIEFKRAGIKVIKKRRNGIIVIKVALLENGFYERYHYDVVQ